MRRPRPHRPVHRRGHRRRRCFRPGGRAGRELVRCGPTRPYDDGRTRLGKRRRVRRRRSRGRRRHARMPDRAPAVTRHPDAAPRDHHLDVGADRDRPDHHERRRLRNPLVDGRAVARPPPIAARQPRRPPPHARSGNRPSGTRSMPRPRGADAGHRLLIPREIPREPGLAAVRPGAPVGVRGLRTRRHQNRWPKSRSASARHSAARQPMAGQPAYWHPADGHLMNRHLANRHVADRHLADRHPVSERPAAPDGCPEGGRAVGGVVAGGRVVGGFAVEHWCRAPGRGVGVRGQGRQADGQAGDEGGG